MISKIVGYNNNLNHRAVNFSSGNPMPNGADKFLAGVNYESKKEENGSFLSRYLWSTTAMMAGATLPLTYMSLVITKGQRLKNDGKIFDLKKLFKHFNRNLSVLCVAGVAVAFLLQTYFGSQTKKNMKKLNAIFNKLNTESSAKLSEKTFRSQYKGAYCNSLNGEIKVNSNLINDPMLGAGIKSLLRHELVHARQFELIARSKDGIKKLNYASISQIAKEAMKSDQAVKEFEEIYNIIKNDTTGKYDNVTFEIGGAKYNFKKYIEAIHIKLNNKSASYNDIPIVSDMSHYEEVIKEKGPLTKDEENKAEEYYQALKNYPSVNTINALNPFGAYRNNILEKEAYQSNQSWLMKLFNGR